MSRYASSSSRSGGGSRISNASAAAGYSSSSAHRSSHTSSGHERDYRTSFGTSNGMSASDHYYGTAAPSRHKSSGVHSDFHSSTGSSSLAASAAANSGGYKYLSEDWYKTVRADSGAAPASASYGSSSMSAACYGAPETRYTTDYSLLPAAYGGGRSEYVSSSGYPPTPLNSSSLPLSASGRASPLIPRTYGATQNRTDDWTTGQVRTISNDNDGFRVPLPARYDNNAASYGNGYSSAPHYETGAAARSETWNKEYEERRPSDYDHRPDDRRSSRGESSHRRGSLGSSGSRREERDRARPAYGSSSSSRGGSSLSSTARIAPSSIRDRGNSRDARERGRRGRPESPKARPRERERERAHAAERTRAETALDRDRQSSSARAPADSHSAVSFSADASLLAYNNSRMENETRELERRMAMIQQELDYLDRRLPAAAGGSTASSSSTAVHAPGYSSGGSGHADPIRDYRTPRTVYSSSYASAAGYGSSSSGRPSVPRLMDHVVPEPPPRASAYSSRPLPSSLFPSSWLAPPSLSSFSSSGGRFRNPATSTSRSAFPSRPSPRGSRFLSSAVKRTSAKPSPALSKRPVQSTPKQKPKPSPAPRKREERKRKSPSEKRADKKEEGVKKKKTEAEDGQNAIEEVELVSDEEYHEDDDGRRPAVSGMQKQLLMIVDRGMVNEQLIHNLEDKLAREDSKRAEKEGPKEKERLPAWERNKMEEKRTTLFPNLGIPSSLFVPMDRIDDDIRSLVVASILEEDDEMKENEMDEPEEDNFVLTEEQDFEDSLEEAEDIEKANCVEENEGEGEEEEEMKEAEEEEEKTKDAEEGETKEVEEMEEETKGEEEVEEETKGEEEAKEGDSVVQAEISFDSEAPLQVVEEEDADVMEIPEESGETAAGEREAKKEEDVVKEDEKSEDSDSVILEVNGNLS